MSITLPGWLVQVYVFFWALALLAVAVWFICALSAMRQMRQMRQTRTGAQAETRPDPLVAPKGGSGTRPARPAPSREWRRNGATCEPGEDATNDQQS